MCLSPFIIVHQGDIKQVKFNRAHVNEFWNKNLLVWNSRSLSRSAIFVIFFDPVTCHICLIFWTEMKNSKKIFNVIQLCCCNGF